MPASGEQPDDQWPAVDFGTDRPAEGDGTGRPVRQKLPEFVENAQAGLLVRNGIERQPGGDFFAAQNRACGAGIGGLGNAGNSGGFCGLIAHGVLECLC